jgi:arylformamidase
MDFPHDISWTLSPELLTYPGDPGFRCEPRSAIAVQGYALSEYQLGSHAGTHLDAPAHFVAGGQGVDRAPLGVLCGPCRVVDATRAGPALGAAFLSGQGLEDEARVLLRTANESLLPGTFREDHAHLTLDGARYLRERTQVRLVGIDYLSIEGPGDASFPVHHCLLGREPPIYVLESLDLRGVPAGRYELACLPLKVRGGDGAPARAVLLGRIGPG